MTEDNKTPLLKVAYKGEAPYIFISYSHKNGNEVYQIIANLQQEGYRVWYDGGIDPGIEWAENIAARVSGCAYFIAFITKEYVESSNCQDELSFARDQEKPRLLVYLENTPLPPGMSMRLNRLQAIHKYTYQNEKDFYEKLYMADGIKCCLFNDGEDGREEEVNQVQTVVQSTSGSPAQPQPAEENKEKKKGGRGLLIGGIAGVAAIVAVAAALILLPGKKNYYDMKKFAWNMAQEDVSAAWSEKPAEEGIADNGLKYVSYADLSVAGHNASAMNLYFAKDGLSLVEYRLSEGDYQTIFDDLYDQYGRPSGETDKEAYWETEEEYRIGVHAGEDGICLYYQIPYVSYYDMQDFAFGMDREEAQKTAEAAGMVPSEDFYGIASFGCPYLRYESMPVRGYVALEGGNAFLMFDEEGLCAIQYQLEDGTYGDIYSDLEDYYGKPLEKDEYVIWEVCKGKYITLLDKENRDTITYRNYEDSSELEIPYWNWQGITLNQTSQEEAESLMKAAGFTPHTEAPEGINSSGTPWQCYQGGTLEISAQKPYETMIWFNMEGAREIQYRFEGDVYQELCGEYRAFYGEPDADNNNYIRWNVDGGGNLQIDKRDTDTTFSYYAKATDSYWNLQGLKIGSTTAADAATTLAGAGLTPYEGAEEGVDSASGMKYLSYQDVELMGRTAYRVNFFFDRNGFNRVAYVFKDGGYQDVLDELVAYYGESTWSDGRIGWSMTSGRWMDIVKTSSEDEYYVRCATNSSKGFYDLYDFKFGMSVEEVQAAASTAGLTVMEEATPDNGNSFIKYGTLSYAGYEDCELTAEFNEENVLTWLTYKIPQAVYNDVCASLDELYGASVYANDGSYKIWSTGEKSGNKIAIYNTDANANAVHVWIY